MAAFRGKKQEPHRWIVFYMRLCPTVCMLWEEQRNDNPLGTELLNGEGQLLTSRYFPDNFQVIGFIDYLM